MNDASAQAVETCHEHIWAHFYHPDTLMFYDYAWGREGWAYLPTANEIARRLPNRAGWGTGMENPALNASQYLPALLLRHTLARHHLLDDAPAASRARQLFAGLRRLLAVAREPGFLPRGLALDGVSHYPNSSIDQYTMLFYALWHYFHSPLCTPADQQAIKTIWHNILTRWERSNWEDRTEDGQPAWYGDIGALQPDRGCRLLAALHAGAALTGESHWDELYAQKRAKADGYRLRAALSPSWPLYVYDQNQVAWRLLAETEPDDALRAHYRQRMAETAAAVRDRLLVYRQFDPAEHARLLASSQWDWRQAVDPPGQPQTTLEQVRAYNVRLRALAPVISYEHRFVQEPFEAAHVLLLSGDAASLDTLREHLPDLFAVYPYDKLVLSWSVYEVEWVYWLAVEAGLL